MASNQIFSPVWHNVATLRPRLLAHTRMLRHTYRGQRWHVIHDISSRRYHRLSASAYSLVSTFNGKRTVQELWESACEKGGNDIPTQNEIVTLLSNLHVNDLISCDVNPDSAQLEERHRKQKKMKWKQRLSSPLSIRIPIFDPDAFLDKTSNSISWIFGKAGALLWLISVLPAIALAAQHWHELTENLSDHVFSAQNLVLMGLLFIPIKALHELGHAYATKVWGGNVPEIGVMLLVFAPVPYVDSSSSSAFQSKRQRAIVGGAGMIVETFIAAIALYVWLLVEPGITRAIALNVMVIAGVSTLIINGNPLLRYDAYYIFSDLIEIPNLAQRGQRYWTYLCDRYLLGAKTLEPPEESQPEKRWIIPYTISAWAYKTFVAISIIWFVATKFFFFGTILAMWGAFTLVIVPIWKAANHITRSPSLRLNRSHSVKWALTSIAVISGFIFFVPMPLRTQAEGVIWLPENSLVKAPENGALDSWFATSGMRVSTGDPLLMLKNLKLDAESIEARASLSAAEARHLKVQFSNFPAAAISRQEIQYASEKLTYSQIRQQNLSMTSTANGVLMVPNQTDTIGRYYKKGDLIAYITDGNNTFVRVAVGQENIDLVRSELKSVKLRFFDNIGIAHESSLLKETPNSSNDLPSAALTSIGGGLLPADPQDQSGKKSLERVFLVDIAMPATVKSTHIGSRVYVRFDHEREPLAKQWYRRLRQLFLSHFNV